MTLRKPAAIALLAAPLFIAACTFLVQFENKDPDEAESSAGNDGGEVEARAPLPDAPSSPDAPNKNACDGRADGFNWSATDRTARCCGGEQVFVTTNAACGGCGIRCSASQNCQVISDHYYCVGCGTSGTAIDQECANSTGCCSRQYSVAGLCAASTCVVGGSECNESVCPLNARCYLPPGASFVCSYWP